MAGAALVPAALGADQGPRIVAFGDSLTAGFGLPSTEGLVPVLQDWLTRHNTPAQIVNEGLSGDTTYGGRVRIHWSLWGGADAVIVALGANDMLLGWSPRQAEANLDAILTAARQGDRPVLLVGLSLRRSGPDWDGIWPRLAERHGCLLLPNIIAPLAAIPAGDRKPYLQADGLHPSGKGVKLLVDHLGPSVQALTRQV
ncbi:arylesterase [Paracoccus sp. M683]|nr:arylesterase [Paracoccus sp. M683]